MVSKHVQSLPERAWQEITVDLLGPLLTGELLLLVVDYFSGWMEEDVFHFSKSAAVIKYLGSHFARYGVPAGLRTDTGSNLKATRVSQAEGKDRWLKLNTFLLAYRSTSHTTTGLAQRNSFSRGN